MNLKIHIPGNLLLAGEYAVLEDQGLGLAVSIKKYVHISVEKNSSFEIISKMGSEILTWDLKKLKKNELLYSIIKQTAAYLNISESQLIKKTNLKIYADSGEFFQSDGSKTGLGSSAAVSAGISLALLLKHINSPIDPLNIKEAVFKIALKAHRAAQGGMGSGYDIAASIYGGTGLFTGGETPHWSFLKNILQSDLLLIKTGIPVSTKHAILSYKKWKKSKPELFSRFLQTSNKLVKKLYIAEDFKKSLLILRSLRKTGIWIGNQLKFQAEPDHLKNIINPLKKHFFCKTLGAGGELAVVIPRENRYISPGNMADLKSRIENEKVRLEKIQIDDKGMYWEQ